VTKFELNFTLFLGFSFLEEFLNWEDLDIWTAPFLGL